MTTPRVRLVLVLAAFLIAASVVATDAVARDREAPARATKVVRAVVSHWSPTIVRISRGDTIRWRAVSGSHTVTAYGGGWRFNKSLPTGDVEARAFRRAGTFRFRCTIHSTLTDGRCSGMCGKVVVRS